MRKLMLGMFIALSILFAGCGEESPDSPIEDVVVTSFEECIAAGNPAMESYPRQCRAGDTTFTEVIEEPVETPDEGDNGDELTGGTHICTAEEKANMACTRDYRPVCGDDDVTYGNGCTACSSGNIDSYAEGECTEIVRSINELCEDAAGTWVDSAMECEHVSEETCAELGGRFNECGSACRNDPDAQICTMQCVPFCSLNPVESLILEDALAIAEASDCMTEGTLTGDSFHNDNSMTWWFDMEVEGNENCAPACVVWDETGETEINWRCTGALP